MLHRKLSICNRMVNAIRLLDDTMPIHWVSILIAVATNEGLTLTDISNKCGLTLSAVSRSVSAMSDWHWMKKPGLGLLATEVDRMDLTKKKVHLTAKGKHLINQLSNIAGEEAAS